MIKVIYEYLDPGSVDIYKKDTILAKSKSHFKELMSFVHPNGKPKILSTERVDEPPKPEPKYINLPERTKIFIRWMQTNGHLAGFPIFNINKLTKDKVAYLRDSDLDIITDSSEKYFIVADFSEPYTHWSHNGYFTNEKQTKELILDEDSCTISVYSVDNCRKVNYTISVILDDEE